jgi:hypothetical protein
MLAPARVERCVVTSRRRFVGESHEQQAGAAHARRFGGGGGGGAGQQVRSVEAPRPDQTFRGARRLVGLLDRLPLFVAQFEQALAVRLVEVVAEARGTDRRRIGAARQLDGSEAQRLREWRAPRGVGTPQHPFEPRRLRQFGCRGRSTVGLGTRRRGACHECRENESGRGAGAGGARVAHSMP